MADIEPKTHVRLKALPGGGRKSKRPPKPPSDGPTGVLDEAYEQRSWRLDDVGNAERLAHHYGDRLRYVPSWGTFLVYEKHYWRIDTGRIAVGKLAKNTANKIKEEAIVKLYSEDKTKVHSWMTKTRSKGRLDAMVDLVKSEKGISIDHTELDSDPWLLNVANGTLDLKICKLRPHEPKDMITRCIPIDYKPAARCPKWERFLQQVIPTRETRLFLQKFLGYCLTGKVGERMFVVMYGGGRNGKSVLLKVVQKVMGAYAKTAAPTLLMSKEQENHPTELAALCGVRMAISNETKKGRSFDEELVKRVTGDDTLSARRMREDFWEFDPTHKLIIATNHKPRVRDATDSFWDRIALILFGVRIADDKVVRDLTARLLEESEGILTWLVEGCRLWHKEGLKRPGTVIEATKGYRDDEDTLGRFLSECCVFEPKAECSSAVLAATNKTWTTEQNLPYPARPNDLAEALSSRGAVRHKGAQGSRGWRGVRLKTRAEKQGQK